MADEGEVYAALGYAWIPPELREHAGELEAARTDALPELLQVEDIRGDLHSHTTVASDGHATHRADGRGGHGARLRLPRDHRPLLGRRHGHGPRRRPPPWPTPRPCARWPVRLAPAGLRAAVGDRGRHHGRRPPRPPRRGAGRAGLGRGLRARRARPGPRGPDEAAAGGRRASARRRHRPPVGPHARPPRRLRLRRRGADRGLRRARHVPGGQLQPAPARPQGRARAHGRARGRPDHRQHRRPPSDDPGPAALRRRHGAARVGDRGRRRQHARLGRSLRHAQAAAGRAGPLAVIPSSAFGARAVVSRAPGGGRASARRRRPRAGTAWPRAAPGPVPGGSRRPRCAPAVAIATTKLPARASAASRVSRPSTSSDPLPSSTRPTR